MKLIDEMRAALPPYVDIKRVRDWADRLAASGALVPVPQGEACELFDLPVESSAYTHNGEIYIYEGMTTDWLCFNVSALRWVQLECDTIVQPVALVPITEAEG